MKEREIIMPVRPVDAVADAMMVACHKQVSSRIKGSLGETEDVTWILTEATKSGCRLSSGYVLAFLTEKYPSLFSRMVIVETYPDDEFSLVGRWLWHDYFLAEGIDGYWYAGSPANYGAKAQEERLTNMIYAKDLSTVMREIWRVEGGLWPTKSEILDTLARENSKIGIKMDGNRKRLEYLCIASECNKLVARRYLLVVG